jgi:hypothetical protein
MVRPFSRTNTRWSIEHSPCFLRSQPSSLLYCRIVFTLLVLLVGRVRHLHTAGETGAEGIEGAALPSIDDEDERDSSSGWGSASAHGSDREDEDEDDTMHDALDLEPLPGSSRIRGGLSAPDVDVHGHPHDLVDAHLDVQTVHDARHHSIREATVDGHGLHLHADGAGQARRGHSPRERPESIESQHAEGSRARLKSLEAQLNQESRRTTELEAQLAAQIERTVTLESTVARLAATVAMMQQQQHQQQQHQQEQEGQGAVEVAVEEAAAEAEAKQEEEQQGKLEQEGEEEEEEERPAVDQ